MPIWLSKILVVAVLTAAAGGKLAANVALGQSMPTVEVAAMVVELVALTVVCAWWNDILPWVVAGVFFVAIAMYVAIFARVDCSCFGPWVHVGWRLRIAISGLCGAAAWLVVVVTLKNRRRVVGAG